MPHRSDESTRKQLAVLRERMNRLFDDNLPASEPAWTPPADVYRAGGRVVITIELPGVAESAIAIEATGGMLRVRGHRDATAPGEVGVLQLERSYGPFLREFALPAGARGAERELRCADGVLRIEIPIG